MEVQRIKIDKLLVDNLKSENGSGLYIIKGIIDLAKMLNIRTIAEGVENNQQIELLNRFGCDEVQGFFWGRPLKADDFERIFLVAADKSAE